MDTGKQESSTYVGWDLACILLLLVLGLIAYAPSFFASFYLDDHSHILKNPAIVDLSNLKGIFAYCPERFLTYLTLAVNYRIGGFDPIGYHIFNFFIHFAAAVFLYMLAREIWRVPALRGSQVKVPGKTAAFAAAGIFFLHPLQTESVTYVIQRAESMAGMFYLAALYFYVRARLENTTRRAAGFGLLAALSALCAAFSKETAVTLPVMIALFEVFLFETSIRELVRNKIFLVLLVPAALVVFYKLGPLLQRDFFYDPEIPFTRKEYLLTQFSVLATYLRLFFYPAGQNIDWDFPIATGFFAPGTIVSFLALLGLLALSIAAYRRFRLVSLGIIGFFISLAPTSSIIPIKDVFFEHRMYLAVAFLAMGFVQVLWYALDKAWMASRRASLTAAFMVIMAITLSLATLTCFRNEVWTSNVSLWKDAVEKSPNKARPHNNYARALYLLGGTVTEQIRREFQIANRLDPAWAVPWHNLAILAFEEGDYERAVSLDLEALERKPYYLAALYQLAKSYEKLGREKDARKSLEQVVKDSPPQAGLLPVYLDLIELCLNTGDRRRALQLGRELSRFSDALPGVDYYRGLAWYKLEDFRRAELYFSRQKAQRGKRIASLLMLGQILYRMEDPEGAEAAFRQVLVDQPWSPAAHYNLSVILERGNRIAEARKHLEVVAGIRPFSLTPKIRLVNLYDQLGEYTARTETLGSLLGLRPDSDEFSFLGANQDRDLHSALRSYAKRFLHGNPGKPHHQNEKTRAVIATLGGDLSRAIEWYEKYLAKLGDSGEAKRVETEIQRLEAILDFDREPLQVPGGWEARRQGETR